MLGEINFWSKLPLKASNLPFENFCLKKKEGQNSWGPLENLGLGLGWGAEILSDWFKKQTPFKMAVIGTNQWLFMEEVRLFNDAPMFNVTPLDNTLDYFVKQLVFILLNNFL